MTAKDKQKEFIKTYLKPTLKNYGFKTAGQTWWKDKGEFYTLINLQNFSWNTADSVDFCFNIGVALKSNMTEKEIIKPTVHNLTVYLRDGFYLPNNRQEHKYLNKTGYTLTTHADLADIIKELKIDFEQYIIPYLEKLNTLQDCLDNYGNVSFWGENLKKVIENSKTV